VADHLIRLPDGRNLCYAAYGDTQGKPVLSFHGGGASRVEHEPWAATFRSLGICLICPDRPGIGLSDFQPGHTLLDWPRDVVALADALELERFGVMGWSLGGQYVLACGYAIPERVSRAIVLASAVPFEVAGTRKDLNTPDRIMLTLSERAPSLAAALVHVQLQRSSPERLQRSMSKYFNERDKAALRRTGSAGAAVRPLKECVRCGTRGLIQEYQVWAAPWGFRLEDVGTEIHVWQGDADTLVPRRYPDLLAERLPRSRLVIWPGDGHISLVSDHYKEIMEALIA
jgi:pimeloyl-ACP methyl ester carboxylesterase